jgi:hypothetical protein
MISCTCKGQISVDSLLTAIKVSCTETGSQKYLLQSFTRFESADRRDYYDLFLDSTGRLQEYIGLSIVHVSFDEKNRKSLIEGFNGNGMRSYWDFPVVQKFRYINDTLVPEMNRIRKEMNGSQDSEILSNVTIIREFNTDAVYDRTRFKVYSQDSTLKLSFVFCPDGEICNRKPEQAAYVFREYDKNDKRIIIQERYYNSKLELVDGNHPVFTSETVAVSSSSKPYAYSIRELKDGKLNTIHYYNQKGELVETSQHGPSVVIDGTSISSGPINSNKKKRRKEKLKKK